MSNPPLPESASPLRIAVVGGGISGLSAAHRLIELSQSAHRPLKLSLFERNHRIGGIFGSEQIGNYLIERGADSFITNKPWGIDLCRRLGLEEELISTNSRFRRSLILRRGRPIPTPEGFNLLAPARMGPMWKTPLLSWRGKLRLALEPYLPRGKELPDESLADFTRRRLGAEMLERIVQPLVGGIYTSDPEQLSLRATLPRFLDMEKQYTSLIRGMQHQKKNAAQTDDADAASGARYGLFVSLKNGMQQLLDTLEQQIVAHTQHRAGPDVTSMEQHNEQWKLTTSDGKVHDFDGVILALPARKSSRLLTEVAPECSSLLSEIESASSAIVVTGHALSDFKHPLDAFGLVIPHCEQRQILATSFLSRKFEGRAPAEKILLRTFVGGAMQPEVLEQSDDALVETVLKELRSIFGMRGQPDLVVVTRYPEGMPQYRLGHLDRIAEIEKQAEKIPQFALAGNYFHGVGIPDCIHRAEQAAESLLQKQPS